MAEIEMALGWCVLLNVVVFAAAYRFAKRRMGGDWVQVILDALLIDYAVQYVAVGIPGLLGVLRSGVIAGTAILISIGLWLGAGEAGRKKGWIKAERWAGSQFVVLTAGAFAVCFLLAFARFQGLLPVMSNDALTYHFPGAVQWLQQGRIDLFSVWFFNPANSYSPLAGSTFIVWLMGPFGNDALARFVEVPALIFVGVGIFQIGRQLGADDGTAALVAAGIVTRPFLSAAMMGKDDLFVVAFFVSALLGLTGKRPEGKFGPVRVGIALGLMLATKYTAVLCAPVLLLAVDGPWKGGWRWRQWGAVVGIVGAIAGPWYLRNFWVTGNPIFPLDVSVGHFHLLRGLFTTAVSDRMRSVGAWGVLTGGFAIPVRLMVLMMVGWGALMAGRGRLIRSEPMLRVCLLGPVMGLMLFVWRSPFAEVRFVFPVFAILFGVVAGAISLLRVIWVRWVIATAWIPAVVFTAFVADLATFANEFLIGAVVATAAVVVFVWLTQRLSRRARFVSQMVLVLVVMGYSYVFWPAYVKQYQDGLFIAGAAWDNVYPRERPLWEFVNQQIPVDATVAYTNLYLVYPLQGFSLQRRLVYTPTRAGMRTQADLPWLGDHLSGEELVPAAVRATVADADENVWLKNLRESGAGYLVIGKGGVLGLPPEAGFAGQNSRHFSKLFEGAAGTVYAVTW